MGQPEVFAGDIALISGANKGIGYEIARGLGAKKIKVLVGARDDERGHAAAEKLKAEGADARFVKLDVTQHDTIRRAAEWIEKEFGRLDILVNNAGIGEWGAKPRNLRNESLRPYRHDAGHAAPAEEIEARPHRKRLEQLGVAHARKHARFADGAVGHSGLQHVQDRAEQHDGAVRQ
jgi:NAD(P)-dependent dehydrogenase (short-subunit alcohol dehydrogenase family)